MIGADTATAASGQLQELVERLEAIHGFDELIVSLRAGHAATLDGAWGSSCALAAAALVRHARGPLVLVCPHPSDVDALVDDLRLFTERGAEVFPAWEALPSEHLLHDVVFGDRLRLLKRLRGGDSPELIVSSIQSLIQPVPSPERLAAHSRAVQAGTEMPLEEFTAWLARNGFQNMTAVQMPGEFSVHGGIVDVYPPDASDPVRIEFFGDEVESLRRFDTASQRSLAPVDHCELTALDPHGEDHHHLADYLPSGSWFLLIEPIELDEEGGQYLNRLDHPEGFHSVASTRQRLCQFPTITAESLAAGSLDTTLHLKIESVERFCGDVARVREQLRTAAAGQQVHIVCPTEGEVKRLSELLGPGSLGRDVDVHLVIGNLRTGFRLVPAQTVVLSAAELFGRKDLHRAPNRRLGRAIDSFLDLRAGDLVVHVAHGIGRYRGLRLLEKENQIEEHLELEFHGGTKLYVPASRIELVQKYVGGTKSRPALARIGGKTWAKQKQRASEAVVDLAADMLELQAMRATRPGIRFPLDTEWQHEFDAAFAYTETPDQVRAVDAIKRDMNAAGPMDRLICGEVGYGKTELSMRAAFKAVDSGYQVAVLVPTTVLAEQHLRTFGDRMAEYPFVISSLSRFRTRKEQSVVIEGLASGEIDIVIGTHRLIQPDVSFHNLGLVIIDEEQRFGVAAKDRLKSLRQIVDVLTLTATPIPRTLHMALLGLRDISNLETPPEDRLAVETRVTRSDEDLVRQAVLRELNRDGQIFFVHNRVHDIGAIARRLASIVPEARLAVAHGQMPEGELERVMAAFVNGKFDMLVATTIVESGLDIPNANTIFINQADRYGLADLHQLRGRVGRYKHRAYCYLLIDPDRALSPSAAKRLRAIEEFSDMGAGFAIAMRDLEIRGAGNILGTEQSGHIAVVGYELYCQLLEDAVRTLKKLPPRFVLDVDVDLPGEAFLPRDYVASIRTKIDLYRRLARVTSEAELDDFASELVDRFGPLPEVVARLVSLAHLRLLAAVWQVDGIHLEGPYAVLRYTDRQRIEQLARSADAELRIVDGQSAYLPLAKEIAAPDATIAAIKSLLQSD